jgi:bifunctional non-homologous end joining protein LigD
MAARDAAADVVDQLARLKAQGTLQVGEVAVPVTNLDKPLWPAHDRRLAVTKRDLLTYLARVSPWMLPHLADRPIFVTRFPNGIEGKRFFQKVWESPPPFVRTVRIWAEERKQDRDYLIGDNLATLLWLGQLAAIEIHAWFSRIAGGPDAARRPRRFTGSEEALERSILNYPDFLVLDLDPYIYAGRERRGDEPELNRAAFERTRDLALELRQRLNALGLLPYVKTSGRTGLHLYVPIRRTQPYDVVRAFAERIGRTLERERPDAVTLAWRVTQRRGKIFFDHNQNSRGKSLAAPYSPRRHPDATVATPVTWDELPSVYPTDFTVRSIPERLTRRGDPWADILTLTAKRDLTPLLGDLAPAKRRAGASKR